MSLFLTAAVRAEGPPSSAAGDVSSQPLRIERSGIALESLEQPWGPLEHRRSAEGGHALFLRYRGGLARWSLGETGSLRAQPAQQLFPLVEPSPDTHSSSWTVVGSEQQGILRLVEITSQGAFRIFDLRRSGPIAGDLLQLPSHAKARKILATGDFNGDGRDDVLFLEEGQRDISALFSTISGFDLVTSWQSFPGISAELVAAGAYLDADEAIDAVFVDRSSVSFIYGAKERPIAVFPSVLPDPPRRVEPLFRKTSGRRESVIAEGDGNWAAVITDKGIERFSGASSDDDLFPPVRWDSSVFPDLNDDGRPDIVKFARSSRHVWAAVSFEDGFAPGAFPADLSGVNLREPTLLSASAGYAQLAFLDREQKRLELIGLHFDGLPGVLPAARSNGPQICHGNIHQRLWRWGAAEVGCRAGHALFALQPSVQSLPRDGEPPLEGVCCALPDQSMLTAERVKAEGLCPEGTIATGVDRNGVDSAEGLQVSCSPVDPNRYTLGPVRPGVKWHSPARGDGVDWADAPAGVRYAMGRRSRDVWESHGCAGRDWNDVFVGRTGPACDHYFYRTVLHREMKDGSEILSPVQMFPDCKEIRGIFTLNPRCVTSRREAR